MRGCRPATWLLLAGAGAAALGGCASIGPQRMGVDRSDYSNHLRETNKEQLLLNIVALRYGDAPLFLEVSSVISQYTREGQVSGGLDLGPAADAPEGNIGASVLLRETPTITYTPLTGDRFARSMLSPISPAALLGMIEAGWAPELLFRLAVRSINGVSNGGRDPIFASPESPEFDPMLAALGRLQRSRAVVTHVERGENARFTAAMRLSPALSDADRADIAYLRQVLNLRGDVPGEYDIVFGAAQTDPRQLAIGTRSMFEIFSEMAHGVEVPEEDIASSRAMPTADPGSGDPMIRIRSGAAHPADAHAAVRYRGRWFWIDGSDSRSKRMFLVAQILLSLNDTSPGTNAPLVTIPAG
jgi:hypothetical protein